MAQEQRGELYAGVAAPDALRLIGGRDKLSTHFYDDQRPQTWDAAVAELCRCHAAVADPRCLGSARVAWMLGYICHLVTDVAYWRHIINRLPAPPPWQPHHGAWLLVDRLPVAPRDRAPRLRTITWEDAPPWVDHEAVRSFVLFMTRKVLPPRDPWQAEIAYHRGGEPGRPSVEELRATHLPQCRKNLDAARAALPQSLIHAFVADAVQRSVAEMQAYLAGERVA